MHNKRFKKSNGGMTYDGKKIKAIIKGFAG